MKIPIKKEFIEVYKAAGEVEAYVIKGLLESNDIPCIFQSQTGPSVYMFVGSGLGEIKILVKPEDAEAAQQLLEGDKNA